MADTEPVGVRAPRVTFLFGAGASKGAGVPLTRDFVTEFRARLGSGTETEAAYDRLTALLQQAEDVAHDPSSVADIEAVLSALEILTAPQLPVRALFTLRHEAQSLPREVLAGIRSDLEKFIRERCIVSPGRTDYMQPFLRFQRDHGIVRVFTTNYDVVLEQFFRRFDVEFSDGFRLRWDRSELRERDEVRAYIFKLQGSVTWFQTPLDGFVSLPILQGIESVKLLSGEQPVSVILYPARKEGFAGPLVELLGMFQQELLRCDFLVVVGYSFRDERIRKMVLDAAASRRSLRLILIDPDADSVYNREFGVAGNGLPSEVATGPSHGVMERRVLRVPVKFEDFFWSFVEWFLPAYLSAIADLDNKLKLVATGQDVDWANVAQGFASVGYLDDLGEIEDAGLLFGDDQAKAARYGLAKALGYVLHGDLSQGRVLWRQNVEVIRGWVQPNGPISIYTMGANETRVRLYLGYPASTGERSYTSVINDRELRNLVATSQTCSALYREAAGSESVRGAFSSLHARLQDLVDYLSAFDDDQGQGRLIGQYLDSRESLASEDVARLRPAVLEATRAGPLQSDSPLRLQLLDLERRLFLEVTSRLRDALGS